MKQYAVDTTKEEYIIEKTYMHMWGIWVAEKDYKKYEPLELFQTRQQAEEYEQELLGNI